jgi:hypothetical protein
VKKVILWQTPNPALIGWAAAAILSYFIHSQPLAWLATALLFTWAFMEAYQGVNYFRRLLGLIILLYIITQQFK